MEDKLAELQKLEKEIQSAKIKKAQIEGKSEDVNNKLNELFNSTDLSEIGNKIEGVKKEIEILGEEIESDYKTLKENFEW